MDTRRAFALAFKHIRKARGLTQEDFGVVSSRTYVSTLERGMKSPTLDKIEELAQTMGVHPLTLLTLTYAQVDEALSEADVLELVRQQLEGLR